MQIRFDTAGIWGGNHPRRRRITCQHRVVVWLPAPIDERHSETQKQKKAQRGLGFEGGHGLSSDDQQYEETASRISEIRAFAGYGSEAGFGVLGRSGLGN